MILRLLQHHANRPFKKTYCLGIILILFLRIRHTIYYTIQHNAAYVVWHSAAQHNTSIPSMTYLYAKINNNGVMTKNCMSLAKYQDQPIHYETRNPKKESFDLLLWIQHLLFKFVRKNKKFSEIKHYFIIKFFWMKIVDIE